MTDTVSRAGAESDAAFMTLTMAKVYAGQGKWSQVLAICHHLLRQDPGDGQAAALLELAEGKIAATGVDRLVPLMGRWASLSWRLKLLRVLGR